MNKDLFYIFDKLTFRRTELGEVQSGFNMSFVIDGTKDSCQIIVWSFSDAEIEPYTICWHEKTDSWWIVSHDKVERYAHDNGFIYIHNLELLGAIELLNARDLTDCGFNDNTYDVEQFLDRLFSLSTYEYSWYYSGNQTFRHKKVEFIKTFENYTLLSAIREFLDAYNMCAKLEFVMDSDANGYYIDESRLRIIPKTGDSSYFGQYNINDFDDVRETKTMDKNSFGTCVVSNAENVISSTSKTFPTIGGLRPSSQEYQIKAENAVLRLPSKVYKGNWLKMCDTLANVEVYCMLGSDNLEITRQDIHMNILSEKSISDRIDYITNQIMSFCFNTSFHYIADFYNQFLESFNSQKEEIIKAIKAASTVTLYDGNKLVPYYGSNNNQTGVIQIQKGTNVPYLAQAYFYSKDTYPTKEFVFCDKDTKNNLPLTWQGIAWERGSNLITGFDGFERDSGLHDSYIIIRNAEYTDLQETTAIKKYFTFTNDYGTLIIRTPYDAFGMNYQISFKRIQLIVNYVPMSDIKLKIDNKKDMLDMQLYNQNGKLTDSVALSKLINSYSKEISSDTITRYMNYRNYNDVPKVGGMVTYGNDTYVINNVSLDFSQNENTNADFGYYIETEITMSKYISTKSLMANPNTNIRDYGIPQNFNVKRKQVYRDYYELSYTRDSSAVFTPYMKLTELNNFSSQYESKGDLTSVIKLTYDNSVNGQTNWYYQLETTRYTLDKMICIVTDFNDNNIIGYGSQNVWSGFVISRILSNLTDTLNTPIQYTDENGRVKGIDLLMLNNEQLTTVYTNYLNANSGSSYDGNIINYSPFIPSYIYSNSTGSGKNVFRINETTYNKDALEVPVFEYICQVDDTQNVLIGDKFFEQHEGFIYFYTFVKGDNLNQNNVMDTQEIQATVSPIGFRLENGAKITAQFVALVGTMIRVDLSTYVIWTADDTSISYNGSQTIESGKDYAIFRHAYNLKTQEHICELMFIAKKVQPSLNRITIYGNAYKLR